MKTMMLIVRPDEPTETIGVEFETDGQHTRSSRTCSRLFWQRRF